MFNDASYNFFVCSCCNGNETQSQCQIQVRQIQSIKKCKRNEKEMAGFRYIYWEFSSIFEKIWLQFSIQLNELSVWIFHFMWIFIYVIYEDHIKSKKHDTFAIFDRYEAFKLTGKIQRMYLIYDISWAHIWRAVRNYSESKSSMIGAWSPM